MVTARQVRAADAIPEKHISTDKKPLLPGIKTNAARRVSRQEEDFQFILSYHHRPAGNEVYEFTPIILEGHSPLQPHRRRHCKDGLLLFVEMEG